MKFIKIFGKIINEIRTESDPLWYKVSKQAVDEMGIKLYFDTDDAYVVEIHFDTIIDLLKNYKPHPFEWGFLLVKIFWMRCIKSLVLTFWIMIRLLKKKRICLMNL